MADAKISELTELAQGGEATNDELVIVDTDAGVTKRYTWSSLRTSIASYIASLTQTLTNKTFGDALNMGSNRITSVSDPTSAQDAATKNYVDAGARTKAASYLLVLAQSTPGLTLQVLTGKSYIGNTLVDYAGGNTGTFSVPVSDDRIDIVSIDSGGTINITEGVEDASPTAPTVPAEELPLAQIYLRSGATSIKDTDDSTNGYIQKDLRPFMRRGKVENYSDIKASRAVATTYTNSTEHWMLVILNVQCTFQGQDADAASRITALIHASADPPTTTVAQSGWSGQIGGISAGNQIVYDTVTFWVPPGWTYRVNTTVGSGDSVTINSWFESEMGF